MPSRGVSDQIGRLVTAKKNSRITGDVETEESADHGNHRCRACPEDEGSRPPAVANDHLLRARSEKASNEKIPNIISAHEPTDIGDQGLKMG